MNNAIQKRQQNYKEAIVEQLKKTPVVEVTCKKIGVGRASYYRWKKEDKEFSENAEEAIAEGSRFINDMAESQLISAIKDRNMTAIIFWLKHHHKSYNTKVEISGRIKTGSEKLSEEQEQSIQKALKLSSLVPKNKDDGKQ